MSNNFKSNSVIQQLILAAIQKMDLVTREEFDIQKRVLLKTRKKVEQLEKLLEQQLEVKHGNF